MQEKAFVLEENRRQKNRGIDVGRGKPIAGVSPHTQKNRSQSLRRKGKRQGGLKSVEKRSRMPGELLGFPGRAATKTRKGGKGKRTIGGKGKTVKSMIRKQSSLGSVKERKMGGWNKEGGNGS